MRLSGLYRIAALAGVAIVALGVLSAGAVGVTAVLRPGCAACHLKGSFASATAASAHAAVACTQCHGDSTFHGRVSFATRQVFGMYLPLQKVDPSTSLVPQAACLRCHGTINEGVSIAAGLRIVHAKCAVGRDCAECHSTTAHGAGVTWPRSTTMEMCFDCHGSGGVPDGCDVCHADRLPADRIRTGSFAVTHGPNYLRTHGLGLMRTCVPCHPASKCARCHGAGLPHTADFVKTHGGAARAADAACEDCHQKAFCSDCHQYEMPHPAAFIKAHADAAASAGEAVCRRCHAEPDCVECHVSHVHPMTEEQMRNLGVLRPGGDAE